ncbi:hypothetical protein EKG36_18085 [Halomonas nitroreducens]|uniref:DUF7282 domain-containing protein n=2 Tax=Halomonas nitroreducens TaxID=447425 RepID=A0A3S0J7C8_9GAMM|nr:hypothetical protein EKG36_18085 [Halomonas nitroreducens]
MRPSTLAITLALGMSGTAVAAGAPQLELSPQSPGASVTVDAVTVGEDAFVVVHASDAGGDIVAPASIGHASVAAGDHQAVRVALDHEVASGERLFVMLHRDTGTPGEYAFGPGSVDVDPPITADGKPVVQPVAVK